MPDKPTDDTLATATTPAPPGSPLDLTTPPELIGDLTPSPSLPPLIPSSDLTILLSDPALIKQYRAGRYKQGTNYAQRVMWPRPLASTLSHIAPRCGDRTKGGGGGVSIDILASCALHIGALDILSWDSTQTVKGVRDRYVQAIVDLSPTTINLVAALLAMNPEKHSASQRTVVITYSVEEVMKSLAGTLGLACDQVAGLCIAHTLASQPNKHVNKRLRNQLEEPVRALRVWLRWKARALQAAIEELEGYSLDDERNT